MSFYLFTGLNSIRRRYLELQSDLSIPAVPKYRELQVLSCHANILLVIYNLNSFVASLANLLSGGHYLSLKKTSLCRLDGRPYWTFEQLRAKISWLSSQRSMSFRHSVCTSSRPIVLIVLLPRQLYVIEIQIRYQYGAYTGRQPPCVPAIRDLVGFQLAASQSALARLRISTLNRSAKRRLSFHVCLNLNHITPASDRQPVMRKRCLR